MPAAAATATVPDSEERGDQPSQQNGGNGPLGRGCRYLIAQTSALQHFLKATACANDQQNIDHTF